MGQGCAHEGYGLFGETISATRVADAAWPVMLRKLGRIFDDRPADMRVKLAAIYAVLLAANVLSWLWAL